MAINKSFLIILAKILLDYNYMSIASDSDDP